MAQGRILIVEDEALIAHELKLSLDAQGYEVAIAENGESALEQARVFTPHLVLLDIILPGALDGIAVAEELIKRDVPVIYITGYYAEDGLFQRARNTEPAGYLAKPLRMTELNRAIDLALFKQNQERHRERERELQAQALRESEERFRRLVEQVPEYSIFTLDTSGRVSSWNSGAERMLGYRSEDTLGQPYDLFFTNEDRAMNVPAEELASARTHGSADDTRWLVRRNGERYWAEGVLTTNRNKEGIITGFTKVNRDATERQRMTEALQERDERLRVALHAARTGTWRWYLRTDIDIIDDSLRELFGLTSDQPFRTIKDFYALVHPDERAQVMASFERTLAEGVHLETEFRVVWPDGSEHWLLDQGEVAHDEEGRPLYLTGACVDITERKRGEQALRESERRFRLFADNVRDYAMIQLDPDGRIVTWNRGAERVLGYTESEILGQSTAVFFTPEDIAKGAPERERKEALIYGRSVDERWHLRKDGTRFWASGILTTIVEERGRLQGFAKIMRDETERRRADEQLRASLHEKEVLLQEIHHRVKNNLQVISSLLRLQSVHIADESTLTLFDEARNRVLAIGGIHELLYQSPDLARVDFGLYLRRLTEDLLAFYEAGENRLHLEIEVTDANLEISQAVPCGLIVNELVTNTLKHAFPGGRRGTLRLSFACAAQQCILSVEDNGVGLPEGFEGTQMNSLGLQLVRILTKQLDGTVRIERCSPGTRFEIIFPFAGSGAGSLIPS